MSRTNPYSLASRGPDRKGLPIYQFLLPVEYSREHSFVWQRRHLFPNLCTYYLFMGCARPRAEDVRLQHVYCLHISRWEQRDTFAPIN